jgi:hypothetical protein
LSADSNQRVVAAADAAPVKNTAAQKKSQLVDQTHFIIIPSYPAWFDLTS